MWMLLKVEIVFVVILTLSYKNSLSLVVIYLYHAYYLFWFAKRDHKFL